MPDLMPCNTVNSKYIAIHLQAIFTAHAMRLNNENLYFVTQLGHTAATG